MRLVSVYNVVASKVLSVLLGPVSNKRYGGAVDMCIHRDGLANGFEPMEWLT